MPISSLIYRKPRDWGASLARYLASWWAMLYLGAVALVMAMSPSTWHRANRLAASRYIYASTWQVLPWFTLLTALISLVIIRIVLVTAQSYGLSGFALEMMVRVLVLELIPLSAAMFAALRAGMAFDASAMGLAAAGAQGRFAPGAATEETLRRLRRDLVPQLVANAFSVLSLAMVSSVIVLVLAYLNVYGLSPWGLSDYTRTVGRVFDPTVTLGFVFKTVLFGLAVAVIPSAALLDMLRRRHRHRSNVQPGALRLLFVLLLIEASSLAIKYI
jgi:phospholipid/cholesterol/gamma-HCH transport system permease protein